MNPLLEARSVLDSAGYRTQGGNADDALLYFEDESILGVIRQYTDAASLVAEWEGVQDRFLREYAGRFREHPDKAWNIYTVHLSTGMASRAQASELFDVEEDFRGTRKLARANIVTKEALRVALLPLIPIQSRVKLTRTNLTAQLTDRLVACNPHLAHLTNDLPINEIAARLLLEGK